MTPSNPLARWALLVPWLFAGCLGLSKDSSLYSSYVLPPGSTVPALEDDPAAKKKLDANDGFGATIPLRSGFANGNSVQYWDLGTLSATTVKPMWIFRRRAPDGGEPLEVDHPNLIDSIPGDTAYTPLRQIFVVFVTDRYKGERMPSLRALEDAIQLGLVEAPQPGEYFVNCSVAVGTVQMQTGPDSSELPQDAYYQGQLVHQFCIGGLVAGVGAFQLNMSRSFSPGNAYMVRRTNEGQPLDEAVLKMDLNGDGDQLDSNTIFDSSVGDMNYTSIWHSIDVAVPSSYKFGDAKSESDLFDKKGGMLFGKADKVVSFTDNGVFLNRPIQQAGGMP